MKILFTGGSSFTGYWFIKELVQQGHEVIACFTQKSVDDYSGIRKERIKKLIPLFTPVFNCKFGDDRFLELFKNKIDVLCHHAADVTNYRSNDFDFVGALRNNTNNAATVLSSLVENHCNTIILTGSVFENNEGKGSSPLHAFSPYGLSKSFTYQTFQYFTNLYKLKLGKFVIPNPFGPFEEPRFTNYLIKNWFEHKVPAVNTPRYVRDNIHVSLLAKVYADFISIFMADENPNMKINPSGYTESQGEFTKRFSNEMKKRLSLPCEFELKEQTDFSEPMKRINTNPVMNMEIWNEQQAWDELAEYYLSLFGGK